jgi:hypothetical protein
MYRCPFPVCLLVLVALGILTIPASAQVPGGGPAKTDCYVEWSGVTPNNGKNVSCQDGDPSCDVDGIQNGFCVLGVAVCAAQTNVPGCPQQTPLTIEKLTVKPMPKTVKFGQLNFPVTAPTLPTPISSPICSAQSIIRLPLKVKKNGKVVPSAKVTLTAVAIASLKPKKDKDVIKLQCVPNTGSGNCNPNPQGGPRELRLVAADSGTDLDNGWSGTSHNFPVVSNSELRVCLTGCGATSNPQCAEDEAQTAVVNGATFGAPLPLLAAGIPVCVVNNFGNPKITGFRANISTGVGSGTANLQSRIFLTTVTQVCPRCSGQNVGDAGTCDSGALQGRACTTTGIVTVENAAGNKLYTLSPQCAPGGTAAGTIPISLPVTTGTSTLSGSPPCPGQTSLTKANCGTCGTVCMGPACNSMNAAGQCVDIKGGISQNCCANDPTTPCFPDPIVRTGSTAPPTPPFPDPTYPKTGNMTVVATYCEASSGSSVVDITTGLPGPGALILPAAATLIQ